MDSDIAGRLGLAPVTLRALSRVRNVTSCVFSRDRDAIGSTESGELDQLLTLWRDESHPQPNTTTNATLCTGILSFARTTMAPLTPYHPAYQTLTNITRDSLQSDINQANSCLPS